MCISEMLDDVVIFGNQKPFPGALLFRSTKAADLSDEELITALAPLIEKLNAQSQDHARIARNMLLPISHGHSKLQKSSKGTVMRNKAEQDYATEIREVYDRLGASLERMKDADVSVNIRRMICTMLGTALGDDDDLVYNGVDSVASIQIRYAIKRLLPPDVGELPLSIVEDSGTVRRLTEFVLNIRQGVEFFDTEDELQLMEALVSEYGSFCGDIDNPKFTESPMGHQRKEVVLLTGSTGSLGAHILETYRRDSTVSKIVCLVRGADEHAANERINKSLVSRGLSPLPLLEESSPPTSGPRGQHTRLTVEILPCKLSDPFLGVSASTYTRLAAEVTTVVHAAWSVNFRMRLRSFVKDHIAGLRHLLNFSLRCNTVPVFLFVSSTASVSAFQASRLVPEAPSTNQKDAAPLGYSRSKWVGEKICLGAVRQCEPLRGKVGILRVGQLSGDTARGVWNATEAWPLLLGSMKATRCLPVLDEALGWLPVDVAARGVVGVVAHLGTATVDRGKRDRPVSEVEVLHILNDDRSATWSHLVSWLRNMGEEFEAVAPSEWVARLKEVQEKRPDHPALKLLGLWTERYGGNTGRGGLGRAGTKEPGEAEKKEDDGPHFEAARAKAMASVLAEHSNPVNEAYFGRLWAWIKQNVG